MAINNKFEHYFVFLLLGGFALFCSALGDAVSFTMLTGRHYMRTNTWNGCVSFGKKGTTFRVWQCPGYELTAAVYAAFHHARYARQRDIPMSYYVVEEDLTSNVPRTVYANFEQIRPPARYDFDIEGENVADLEAHILPFAVSNPISKVDLHCVLVAYFSQAGQFVFAVYVNINDGNVSLDFHEAAMDEYLFVASESRYPYLTPFECRKQRDVYIKYFKRESGWAVRHKTIKSSVITSHIEEVKVDVPGL